MDVNYVALGLAIKIAREQKMLTQAKLAEQIERSASYVGLIEVAKRHVSLVTLIRISSVLGVSLDQLLTGSMMDKGIIWDLLLSDCSCFEFQVMYDVSQSIKQILRLHRLR